MEANVSKGKRLYLILNKVPGVLRHPIREGNISAKSFSADIRIQRSGLLLLMNRSVGVYISPISSSTSFAELREFSTSPSSPLRPRPIKDLVLGRKVKEQKRSNLDSLLDSFPSLSENLHLCTTMPNIKECSQVLLRMFNSLNDPVVKLYLQDNCLHLMSLDKYSKQITKIDFPDYMVDGSDKQGHPNLYTGKSGCYAFLCLKTGDYYVGSALCFNTRYKAHKVNSSRLERGGSNSLYISVRRHGWHNFI